VTTAGSNGQTNFTVNGSAVSLTTAESSVALAVTKANADLGASSAVEAYANGSNLGFRNKANGTTTITIGGADASLFAAASAGTAPSVAGSVKTVDTLVNDINTNTSLTGKVRASNDGGKLRIENLSTESMTVVGASSTDVNGGTGTPNTQTIGGNDVRKGLMSQFNDLRNQLDKLAGDAGYNGINLLRADKLKITLNELGTSNVEIQAKNTAGTVRAISTETTSLDLGVADATEFSSDTNLDARLDKLTSALTTLQTQSSSFGASLTTVQTRQEFTKAMINTLQSGADELTLADANEEGANLLSLNTRQQLSQTALSLASQASQAVLRLF
jgi:flagellin-like hook-associated protein FlgL